MLITVVESRFVLIGISFHDLEPKNQPLKPSNHSVTTLHIYIICYWVKIPGFSLCQAQQSRTSFATQLEFLNGLISNVS